MNQLSFEDFLNSTNCMITPSESTSEDKAIKDLINKRRRQILIHSCIYYRMNDSIIDDNKFDIWSNELVTLQNKYPKIADSCIYAKDFKNFDGTTGFDLPINDSWVIGVAMQLLNL